MKRSLRQTWNLIWQKSVSDLQSESARALLGLLWWIIEPVLYMAVFYLVFKIGFRMGGPDFVAFLLAGLVCWKWFQGTVSAACTALIANQGLMAQVYLPKWSFVAMVVLTNAFKFSLLLLLFLLYLLAEGYRPTGNWLYLVPLLGSLLILICGCAANSAFVTCFVPEAKLIIDNGLMLLFFVSGIFFDISARDTAIGDALLLNPLAGWFASFRHVVLEGGRPELHTIVTVSVTGAILLLIGVGLLRRFDHQIAKVSL
ncbi:MAG: hypothetical protein AAF515_14630 [Pseudomonadota bacterium]